jgi:hypothetical protein
MDGWTDGRTVEDIGPLKVTFEYGTNVFSMNTIDVGVKAMVRVTNM